MATSTIKKPTKKTPAAGRKGAPAPAPEQTEYTLADVVKRLGEATREEARLELEGLLDAELITKGSRVATPRLAKELARNYGVIADWLPKASRKQLELLGFVNTDWLRIAAWSGHQAEIHHEALQRGTHGKAADKRVRETNAEALGAEAKRSRDQLWAALRHLSGGLSAWKTKVEAAYATTITASPAADGILAMADVADAMLADKSPGMAARRKRSRLDAASLKRCRELAKKAIAAAKAAGAVTKAAEVKQPDVDFWDGIALTFFEQFVDAADAAHEVDPTVPAPSIIGLRSWFGRLSRKRRGEDGGGKEDGGSGATG
jgi:hypothetical protein